MQRVTVSLDEDTAAAFDALALAQGYHSRSEAVRDLVRRAVDDHRLEARGPGRCIAALSYVYDHHQRGLNNRLIELQHDHHDLVVASGHVHLDHDTCLENLFLRGPVDAVRGLADRIRAERGVRYGAINLVSAAGASGHSHA